MTKILTTTLEEFLRSELLHDFMDNHHVTDEEVESDPVFDGECKSCYALYKLRTLVYEEYAVTDELLEDLWASLGDVPIDKEERLDENWRQFPRGTPRTEVWRWFDKHHSKGVVWLMYGRVGTISYL